MTQGTTTADITSEHVSDVSKVFVARQPIVDATKSVFAYEVLFRSGDIDHYDHHDGDDASLRVMANTLNLIGCDACVGDRQIFINVSRQILLRQDYAVMPRERTVLELLETVAPDPDIIAACQRAKNDGYQLALDDFVYAPCYEPLLELADFVKIDFRISDEDTRRDLAEQLSVRKVKLLAEKVETHEEFTEARDLGFVYFQGYFLMKPQIVSGDDISAQQHNYIQLLQLANERELRYDLIEEVIQRKPALSIKLLRYLNCAQLGLPQKVTSIKHALTLLGETTVRKWVCIAIMGSIYSAGRNPMVAICLARARFCELMAQGMGTDQRQMDMFMLGLLSGLETIFNHPLGEILIQIPVARDVKIALHGADTQLGKLLTLLQRLELADWVEVDRVIDSIAANSTQVADAWREAIRWAGELETL